MTYRDEKAIALKLQIDILEGVAKVLQVALPQSIILERWLQRDHDTPRRLLTIHPLLKLLKDSRRNWTTIGLRAKKEGLWC